MFMKCVQADRTGKASGGGKTYVGSTRHTNKKGNKKEKHTMRKNKLAASLLLAGALAAQAGMPALAAYTADNNPYGDQHTTFGVRETNDTTLPGQVSFQVPLYVTMVAQKGKTDMTVPSNYKIQNNAVAANGKLNEIGVVKVTAEHLGSDWSVLDDTVTPNARKEMTFKMGGLDVAKKLIKKTSGDYELEVSKLSKMGEKNVLFDVSGKDSADVVGGTSDYKKALNPFVGTSFVEATGDTVKRIAAAGGNVVYNLESTITNENDRSGAEDTVAVFKVVYTVAALDDTTHKPVSSVNTYIGEDAGAAGYKYGQATNGKN